MSELPAFPKPHQKEHKITLSQAERRKRLDELCEKQHMRCAGCGNRMTREPFRMNSAELDHIKPEPAGCKKNDNPENHQALCHKCNYLKGSKRQ